MFATFQEHLRPGAKQGKGDPTTLIPTFFSLYVFAFIYQLVLVWDALRAKNTIQIIGLVGLNAGLLIYGAVQVDQLHDSVQELLNNNQIEPGVWETTKPLTIVIPSILAFTTLCLAYLAYKLYNEFAWTIYKHISADLRMKRRYLTYQIYIALLKFDFFFFLGFTVQFVVIVRGRNLTELILTACAIPVTIIIMFMAFWFTKRESLAGTWTTIVLYFAGLAYFCFKLVRMYQPGKRDDYIPARKELTTFAVLTILLLIATIVVAIMCAGNFGKGLKPYVNSKTSHKVEDVHQRHDFDGIHGNTTEYPSTNGYPMANDPYKTVSSGRLAPTRMEID